VPVGGFFQLNWGEILSPVHPNPLKIYFLPIILFAGMSRLDKEKSAALAGPAAKTRLATMGAPQARQAANKPEEGGSDNMLRGNLEKNRAIRTIQRKITRAKEGLQSLLFDPVRIIVPEEGFQWHY
jgi:hypothetical protein